MFNRVHLLCRGFARLRRSVYRVALAAGVGAVAVFWLACGERSEPPAQPVAFNHERHARAGIECIQCHPGAYRGARAGLAPLSVCASCHFGTIPDHPEVAKILDHYTRKQPLRWRKVTVLPASAMVHFPHRPHVRAGVACEACHGDVASMTLARKVEPVDSMSFCLHCHEQRGASTDCLACHH